MTVDTDMVVNALGAMAALLLLLCGSAIVFRPILAPLQDHFLNVCLRFSYRRHGANTILAQEMQYRRSRSREERIRKLAELCHSLSQDRGLSDEEVAVIVKGIVSREIGDAIATRERADVIECVAALALGSKRTTLPIK